MLKICYIVESFELGVRKHIIDLIDGIKCNDYKIFIIIGNKRTDIDAKTYLLQHGEIQTFIVSEMQRNIDLSLVKAVAKVRLLFKKIEPDIVHCHSSIAGLIGRIAAIGSKNTKIIYSPHALFFLNNNNGYLYNFLIRLIEYILGNFKTNIIISTSKSEHETIIQNRLISKDSIVLITHGLKATNERIKHNTTDNRSFNIVAISRMESQKDPLTMISIFNKIIEQRNDVDCYFIGDGSLYDRTKSLAIDLDRIKFIGRVGDIDQYLDLADIYVTSSLYEGLPYTLIQVLEKGIPIVATDVDGNRDCVFDGVNGHLFRTGDVDTAVIRICNIIDEKKIIKYSNESIRIFRKYYSYNTMIAKYIEVYNKLVMERK